MYIEFGPQLEPKCGWEEIALAMRRYSENVVIQTKGCCFFFWVACGHSHDQKIVDAGALGLIIQSMRNFPEHVELQDSASAGLQQIANSTDEIKRQLCDAGAPEAMCTTMRTFGSNFGVQIRNVAGVASLALGDCGAADRFVANGAHLLIQDAAGRHSHLAGFCCAALTALCRNCNHDTSLQLLEDRSVNTICQALAQDLPPRHQEKGSLHQVDFCCSTFSLALKQCCRNNKHCFGSRFCTASPILFGTFTPASSCLRESFEVWLLFFTSSTLLLSKATANISHR